MLMAPLKLTVGRILWVEFIEAASQLDAAHIVSAALIDGKTYEREKWALEISERGLPDKIYDIRPRKQFR